MLWDADTGEIVTRSHWDRDGMRTVEIVEAPHRALIGYEMVQQLDRDPEDPDVVVLAPGYRYRLGRYRMGPHVFEADRVLEEGRV